VLTGKEKERGGARMLWKKENSLETEPVRHLSSLIDFIKPVITGKTL